MISGKWTNALKGISNESEIIRILGAFSTLVYVVITPIFVAAGTIKDVSLTEFSLAYPAGIAACIGIVAKAIEWKDKAVASATVTRRTGAVPAAPAEGPQVEAAPMPDKPDD